MLAALDVLRDVLCETYGYGLKRWVDETWCEPWGKCLPLHATLTTHPAMMSDDVEIRLLLEWRGPLLRTRWYVSRGYLSMRQLIQATSAVRAARDSAERLLSALEPDGEPWGTYHPLAEAA